VKRLGPRSLDEPRLLAGVDLLRRTGATETQIRFHDDEKPVVWLAVAVYSQGAEAAGALDPTLAVLRLCEQVVDGGQCTHCKRPAGLDPDTLDRMPLDQLVCWYQYDPELQTFRRGCEGDTVKP
jgi:hypothetical protein